MALVVLVILLINNTMNGINNALFKVHWIYVDGFPTALTHTMAGEGGCSTSKVIHHCS